MLLLLFACPFIGKCLNMLNITPTNTHDHEGLSVFHPHIWYNAFFPGEDYFPNSLFPYKCCSRKSISFKVNVLLFLQFLFKGLYVHVSDQ